MNTRKIDNSLIEITTDSNHILHRKGQDDYLKIRKAVISINDLNNWEEISIKDIPNYTQAEYKEEIIKLIKERYDKDDEIAILRKVIQSPANERYINEYNEYNSFVEYCKTKAKEILKNNVQNSQS